MIPLDSIPQWAWVDIMLHHTVYDLGAIFGGLQDHDASMIIHTGTVMRYWDNGVNSPLQTCAKQDLTLSSTLRT